YRKEDVLRKLNSDNYYIDMRALETFIKDWQLDPIYEAKDGTLFFDDTAIFKLKKGISLKSQGYNNEQICYRIHKNPIELTEEENLEDEFKSTALEEIKTQAPEVRNVALSVTNQTLQLLAEAVASKITDDIKNHIDSSQFAEKLVEAGEYKKDNETLAKQIVSLIADNRKLAKRIDELEKKQKPFWKRIFG
ncbi:hypothetical protein IJ707_04960, partial [bacterium]|nr:hypothetical protein [bacterium]